MAPLNAQRGAGDGCGSRCGSACKVDPELDALRGDPRFAALLEKVGLEP